MHHNAEQHHKHEDDNEHEWQDHYKRNDLKHEKGLTAAIAMNAKAHCNTKWVQTKTNKEDDKDDTAGETEAESATAGKNKEGEREHNTNTHTNNSMKESRSLKRTRHCKIRTYIHDDETKANEHEQGLKNMGTRRHSANTTSAKIITKRQDTN